MILMRTKYLENSLRDSSLPKYSIAKILFIPGSLDDSKMPFEQLFLDDPLSEFDMLLAMNRRPVFHHFCMRRANGPVVQKAF